MKQRALGVLIGVVVVGLVLFWLVRITETRAQITSGYSTVEVAPYKFADLPHGRIYKAVHEGCELYIVESDAWGHNGYEYSIAKGRCK